MQLWLKWWDRRWARLETGEQTLLCLVPWVWGWGLVGPGWVLVYAPGVCRN